MAALTLTILGASPAAPNPGGACSGYLVRHADTAVLIDCGPGTAGRIPLHVPVQRLYAAAISHLHPDHYFDLVQLYYMLRFGERRPAELAPRLPVYVPPGGREFLGRLGELISGKATMLDDFLDLREYAAGVELDLGGLTFTFHPVQHYVPSHGMRAQSPSGAVLAFSSDVGPCPELIQVAREADLFLCESALLDPTRDDPNPTRRGHMSAGEAGAAATQAGARQLLITHCRSGDAYDGRHLEAARSTFAGPVDLAREGQTYTVG